MQHQEGSSVFEASEGRHEAHDEIEQLRELLFGPILHDIERRIARADAQHAARENDLKNEARRRIEIIESHLRKELEALATRVEHEVTENSEALRNLTRDQRGRSEALEQRVAKLEESMAQAYRQIRQEVLDQAKTFLDEVETMRLELSSTLERRLSRMESDLEIGAAPDEGEP